MCVCLFFCLLCFTFFIDFIPAIFRLNLPNVESFCVFLYNIYKGVSYDIENTEAMLRVTDLNAMINANAVIGGYTLHPTLGELVQQFIGYQITVPNLGITILLMFFARYYARGQYPLFTNQFRCISELELFEKILLKHNTRSLCLPSNMAIDKKYGLYALRDVYIQTGCMTIDAFNVFMMCLKTKTMTCDIFVDCVKFLHITIIESLYMLTSTSHSMKLINECHELVYTALDYTFTKCEKSSDLSEILYWFLLPKNAIWFAYNQGRYKYSAYTSSDTNTLMTVFDRLPLTNIVIGYVADNSVFPLMFVATDDYGPLDWRTTYQIIEHNHYNMAYHEMEDDPPSLSSPLGSNFHYVKHQIPCIFKYVKPQKNKF
jgi:hypothetical protein